MPRLSLARASSTVLALFAALFATSPSLASDRESQLQNFGPANDDFANAETLLADLALIPGNLNYSTKQLNEPRISSASVGRTVWYKYTATETGRAVVFVTKRYSEAPFQIAVYGGTKFADLKRLGAKQIAGTDADYSGSVGFDAVKGTTYFIQIDAAPQTSGFVGTFLIGVKPVGSTGNIAAFANQQLVFQEYSGFDSDRKVFVANGHKATVNVTYGLSNLNSNLGVSTSKTTLKANETAVYSFSDSYSDFAEGTAHAGSLDLIAKATATSSILGGVSVPVKVVTLDRTNKPAVQIRFVDAKPGAPISGRTQSIVHVRNTSKTKALNCRFDNDETYYNSVVATKYREILSDGTYGNVNAMFSISAGTTRKFLVQARVAHSDYYRAIALKCGHYYGSFSDDESSYLVPYPYYGIYPNLRIVPTTQNVFGEIHLADFGSKRVYVTATNMGDYSGYFQIYAEDETYEDRAVITSMCVLNASNACAGPASTDRVDFNLANGESVKIAVDVRRGSSSTPGEVKLWGRATDYDSYDTVGYGAFTLMK